MSEENITITRQEYYELRLSSSKLDMLECAGVDNWEWYGEAYWPEDGEDLDDLEAGLHREIFGEEKS